MPAPVGQAVCLKKLTADSMPAVQCYQCVGVQFEPVFACKCCKHFQACAQYALRTHARAPQASTCSAGRPPHRVQVPSIAENWQTQPAHLALADALGNGPNAVATMIRACLSCCCFQLELPGMCSTMRSVRMHMHCMPAFPWQAQPTYLALAKRLIGRLAVTSICLHVYRTFAANSSWRATVASWSADAA